MSRIFVLGNASIDLTLNVARLPHPGETLIATGRTRTPGGKGLNQAVVAVRAGIQVHFCAPLGIEPETAILRAALAAENFASLHLPDVGQPTDLSMLMVAPDGENCIVSTGACAAALPVPTAVNFVAAMRANDVLLLQGNLSHAATLAAAKSARRVILNAAPIRWPTADVATHCEIVIANRPEAEQIAGDPNPARSAGKLGGRIGIVTLGAEGCILATADAVTHIAAPRVDHPADTTGAGDSFCGALAAALAQGLPLTPAIHAAQHAAARCVARPGCFPALPTRTEMTAILAASPGPGP